MVHSQGQKVIPQRQEFHRLHIRILIQKAWICPFLYFKESPANFPTFFKYASLPNSEDPDEIPHNPFNLGLTFCKKNCLWKSRMKRIEKGADAKNSVRGSGQRFTFFLLVINVFHTGPYEPPPRNNWAQAVQLLIERVNTSISKETYSHL